MFYQNLQELCRRNETTISFVVKQLGISTGMPTFWKKGAIPKSDTLQKLADYFHVTTDELLNGPKDGEPPSKLHREPGEKIAVLASVGAGIPFDAINTFDQDDPESWEEISRIDAKGPYPFFALRVRGDSMEKLIFSGDLVIVRIQDSYDDGDLVVALVNGDEGVCKILEYRNAGGIALISLNAAKYPPMTFTRQQIEDIPVRIMGRVIEIRRRVGRIQY